MSGKKKNGFSVIGRISFLVLTPVILVGGLTYAFIFNPSVRQSLFFPCILHALTGFYCPSCGFTRSLHALVHFDLLKALQYNLLFPFLVLLLAWLYVSVYIRFLTGRFVLRFPKDFKLWWLWAGFGALILFTILRNIPVVPFSYLAPPP